MCKILSQIIGLYRRKLYVPYVFIGIFSAAIFIFLQAEPLFADPDSFYHAKISSLMSEQLIVKNFPWLVFTNLPQIYTDHHFLYHIFLIPFVKFFNPLIGIKIATTIIDTGFILLFYSFLKSCKAKWPEFFTFLLLGSAPFMFRINLAKANGLSLIFVFFLLFALFRKKYFWLFIISFFYVWAYGGWPLGILLASLYWLSSLLSSFILRSQEENKSFHCLIVSLLKSSEWGPFVAVIAGSLAGLIINPYFPQNLQFYWVQTFQIAVVNYGSKIGVGGEWYPFDFFNLISYGWPVILSFLLAILFFAGSLMLKKQRDVEKETVTRTFFLTALSGIFFVLTLKSCRNAEYFLPFMAVTCSFLLKYFYDRDVYLYLKNNVLKILKSERNYKLLIFYVVTMIIVSFVGNVWQIKGDLSKGFSFNKYKEAATIMAESSKAGDIVFHSDWDDWPILFYNNSKNYYIVGLDATFMYEYNQNLYQKWRDITWGKYDGDAYTAIKDDFDARLVFIADGDIQKMDKYFNADERYELLYNGEGKVYRIK